MEHLGNRVWHAECRRCREGRRSEAKVVVGRAVGITVYVTGMAAWSSGGEGDGEDGDDEGGELREAQVTS
jgi:hypothetical protein